MLLAMLRLVGLDTIIISASTDVSSRKPTPPKRASLEPTPSAENLQRLLSLDSKLWTPNPSCSLFLFLFLGTVVVVAAAAAVAVEGAPRSAPADGCRLQQMIHFRQLL